MDNPKSPPVVLVVDDDRALCHLLQSWLEKDGYRVEQYHDGQSCLAALAHTLPEAVFLDLHMPGLSGLDTLERLKSRHPMLPVIILTADTQVDSIVRAMRLGAYDYLTKPIQRTDLENRLRHAVNSYQMTLRLTQLEREVDGRGYPGIVGTSPPMKSMFSQMDRLTGSDITVLIQGESGTGKELVAQAIHRQSARQSGPFVPVNCAAIPETLQESELFGHEKGAFTGATTRRIGRFEQANRGTLFLDEVAELALPAQAKLLRVLQERKFTRVGGAREQSSDFRLIAATHRNLSQFVKDRLFREDLYFRVAVFELDVPPLRDRDGDTALLARHFLQEFAAREGNPTRGVSGGALHVLGEYSWPGNVRELENAMQRATVITDAEDIDVLHLPPRILKAVEDERRERGVTVPLVADDSQASAEPPSDRDLPALDMTYQPVSGGASQAAIEPPSSNPFAHRDGSSKTLEQLEKEAIRAALDRLEGNVSRVCRELGIGRTTLYRKLKKYELR